MKKFLIPLLMVVAGLGGGVAAGLMFGAPAEEVAVAGTDAGAADCAPVDRLAAAHLPQVETDTEFVKFHNQFMVPVMEDDIIDSLIVLSISVEVRQGRGDAILDREPKLRDAFLRVLFDHANAGGFSGNFFGSVGLDTLRAALRETAVGTVGPDVADVLIVDLVKQDV